MPGKEVNGLFVLAAVSVSMYLSYDYLTSPRTDIFTLVCVSEDPRERNTQPSLTAFGVIVTKYI